MSRTFTDPGEVSKYLLKSSKRPNMDVNPIGEYIFENSEREPDILRRLREETFTSSVTSRLGGMICDSLQCQLLRMLLKMMNAKKAIEIGVFTGYNLLSVALTLPSDGKVIGCDVSSEYFDIGRPFIQEAGVMDKIDLRIQPALKTLDELLEAGEAGTFDFVFVDADKKNYDNYYEKSLLLLRPGGIIALDNMLWKGLVVFEEKDETTQVLHKLSQKIHKDERVESSFLPFGDGLNLARKI